MTSKVIKCNNCNIVICELLAFIQNKLDVMNEDHLVRLCKSSFSKEDIEDAKNLLFESVVTFKRKITRKKEGKAQRDLYDVIALFKESEPEDVPIFVARDLQKLPPVHFDHIDVTRLLKDILVLQSDLKKIKETYVTEEQIIEIKNEMSNLKQTSILDNYEGNINFKRGTAGSENSFYLESEPSALPQIPKNTESSINESRNQKLMSSTLLQSRLNKSVSPPNAAVGKISSAEKATLVSFDNKKCKMYVHDYSDHSESTAIKSFANIAGEKGQWKIEKPNEKWIHVQRKRLKNRLVGEHGKAAIDSQGKFRAADTKVPLFISNVDKTVSESDIIDYILRKTNVIVTLQKIKMRYQKDYNAYKVFAPKHKLLQFLDDNLWPEGVSFRRFIDFRYRRDKDSLREEINGIHKKETDKYIKD